MGRSSDGHSGRDAAQPQAADTDVAEAEAALELLAAVPAEDDLVMRDVWVLRSRTLLAKARGDAAEYARLRDSYRDMVRALEFDGHVAWSEAMP